MAWYRLPIMKQQTVFVGLSGGVDSSVAALRVLKAGYRAVGVFIKVWHPDFLVCDWEKERLDAMRVAAHLRIPFITFNAEDAYKQEVADYMIREYSLGNTPNPDVMCNEYVKFGAFLNFALENGADKIATGHYARVIEKKGKQHLYRGIDSGKDQSYFLWRLREYELAHTLFPVGDTHKTNIRKEATQAGIPTSEKRDSQGICFLGHIDMKEFLGHYVPLKEGRVLDESGASIGTHDGALLYTLGQRHGFEVLTASVHDTPHYVTEKDIAANTITVSTKPRVVPQHTESLELEALNSTGSGFTHQMEAQFRYRQTPFQVTYESMKNDHGILRVTDVNIEYPSRGQSCVFYNGEECLGGGRIA